MLEGLGEKRDGVQTVEVDTSLCEILGPPFLPPGTPWEGNGGDFSWLWAGGSLAAALAVAGLPEGTPVVDKTCWPAGLPEKIESAHSRYASAIAAAAARARRAGGSDASLLLITHGEAVRRAVTRLEPTALVFEVKHCGWVAIEWEADGQEDDPGTWALLPDESVGVGWLA